MIKFAQESSKESDPIFVKKDSQIPFHWADKTSLKLAAVQVIPNETQFA